MPTVIRLVDKSVLVRIDPAADASGQPTQYLMLDTIREFGAERLALSGAAGGTRNRFVARYLAMAEYFRDHFLGDDQLDRLLELRREHASVRAALEYALGDQAVIPRGDDPPTSEQPGPIGKNATVSDPPARTAIHPGRRRWSLGRTASSSPPHCRPTGVPAVWPVRAATGSARPPSAHRKARPPGVERYSNAATS